MLFRSDPSTGALSALSPASVAATFPGQIALTPDGQTAFVSLSTTAKIAQFPIASGKLGTATLVTLPANAGFIQLNAAGTNAYVASSTGNVIYPFSVASGVLTALSPASVATTSPMATVISPNGQYLYAPTNASASIQQFAVGGGGGLTALSPATVAAAANAQYPTMVLTPPAELAYVTPPSTLYKTTGQYTVSFNRPIDPATITTSDFVLGGPSTGWAVTAVAAVTGTNNTQFTVTITGTSPTDGSIDLDLQANSIADSAGVVGPGTGPSATKAATIQYLQNPAVGAIATGLQGSDVVTWTLPADTASITGWKVLWGTSAGAGMTNTVSLDATATSWVHNGLPLGTTYYYKVVATGPAGDSAGAQLSATPGWTKTVAYSCTSAAQSFTVPAGVGAVQVDAYGARGGQASPVPLASGGLGGRVQGVLPVTPGSVLNLYVGCSSVTTAVGFNGGGSGAGTGSGGGGATDIRVGGTALAKIGRAHV